MRSRGFSLLEMVVVVALLSALALAATATFQDVSGQGDQESDRLRLNAVVVEVTRASGEAPAGAGCETTSSNRYFAAGRAKFGNASAGAVTVGDQSYAVLTSADSRPWIPGEASVAAVDFADCAAGVEPIGVAAVLEAEDQCLAVVVRSDREVWGQGTRPAAGCRADDAGISSWARGALSSTCTAERPCALSLTGVRAK